MSGKKVVAKVMPIQELYLEFLAFYIKMRRDGVILPLSQCTVDEQFLNLVNSERLVNVKGGSPSKTTREKYRRLSNDSVMCGKLTEMSLEVIADINTFEVSKDIHPDGTFYYINFCIARWKENESHSFKDDPRGKNLRFIPGKMETIKTGVFVGYRKPEDVIKKEKEQRDLEIQAFKMLMSIMSEDSRYY